MSRDAHTYDEWRRLGKQVNYGEKSSGRNAEGQATFTEDQLVNEPDWLPSEMGINPSDLY